MPANDEICFLTAVEMAARIRRGDLSAREVMDAHLAQIVAIWLAGVVILSTRLIVGWMGA